MEPFEQFISNKIADQKTLTAGNKEVGRKGSLFPLILLLIGVTIGSIVGLAIHNGSDIELGQHVARDGQLNYLLGGLVWGFVWCGIPAGITFLLAAIIGNSMICRIRSKRD